MIVLLLHKPKYTNTKIFFHQLLSTALARIYTACCGFFFRKSLGVAIYFDKPYSFYFIFAILLSATIVDFSEAVIVITLQIKSILLRVFFCNVDALNLLFCFLENISVEYSCYVDLQAQGLIFYKNYLFEDGFSGCSTAIAERLF